MHERTDGVVPPAGPGEINYMGVLEQHLVQSGQGQGVSKWALSPPEPQLFVLHFICLSCC